MNIENWIKETKNKKSILNTLNNYPKFNNYNNNINNCIFVYSKLDALKTVKLTIDYFKNQEEEQLVFFNLKKDNINHDKSFTFIILSLELFQDNEFIILCFTRKNIQFAIYYENSVTKNKLFELIIKYFNQFNKLSVIFNSNYINTLDKAKIYSHPIVNKPLDAFNIIKNNIKYCINDYQKNESYCTMFILSLFNHDLIFVKQILSYLFNTPSLLKGNLENRFNNLYVSILLETNEMDEITKIFNLIVDNPILLLSEKDNLNIILWIFCIKLYYLKNNDYLKYISLLLEFDRDNNNNNNNNNRILLCLKFKMLYLNLNIKTIDYNLYFNNDINLKFLYLRKNIILSSSSSFELINTIKVIFFNEMLICNERIIIELSLNILDLSELIKFYERGIVQLTSLNCKTFLKHKIGILYFKSEQFMESYKKIHDAIHSCDKNNIYLLNNLYYEAGFILYDKLNRKDEGIEYIKKCLLQYKNKNYQELSKFTKSPDAFYFIGLMYEKNKDIMNAFVSFETSYLLLEDINNEELKDIILNKIVQMTLIKNDNFEMFLQNMLTIDDYYFQIGRRDFLSCILNILSDYILNNIDLDSIIIENYFNFVDKHSTFINYKTKIIYNKLKNNENLNISLNIKCMFI